MLKLNFKNFPGFVDLQVNGYLGIDFSSEALSAESFEHAATELFNAGTAIFLPTLITSTPDLFERNLKIISKVMEKEGFKDRLPGLHIEGPFLSAEDGARGAHNGEWMMKPDIGLLEKMIEWSNGKVSLITIAAELEGADQLCKWAVKNGIRVSLGHQMAGQKEVDILSEAGASAVTHLGNGIPKLIDRHENAIYATLNNDNLKAMLITDGHHIPDSFIGMVKRVKGIGNIIIVSDAAPISGLKPGRYNTLGNEVVLSETGKLYNPDTGYLVGSSARMIDCVNYLLKQGICTVEEVMEMAVINPLNYLGISLEKYGAMKPKKSSFICKE